MSDPQPPLPFAQPDPKPWWQSRRAIGLLLLLAGLLKDLFHWKWLDAVDEDALDKSLELVGFVVAAWGAVKANQPIKLPFIGKKTAAVLLACGLFSNAGCAGGKAKPESVPYEFHFQQCCRAFLILCLGFAVAACAVISPPPEDIAAVRAVAQRLPELLESNEKVYRTTIEALAMSLRKHALSEAGEQADFQLLLEGAMADHNGVPFGAKAGPDTVITGERVSAILARLHQDEQAAGTAIQALYDAGMNHQAHGDLKLLVELLNRYVMARMSRDEAQAIIATQAHDLIYSKKGGQ